MPNQFAMLAGGSALLLGVILILFGVLWHKYRQIAKEVHGELPDKALNQRQLLDVRSAFYVSGITDADVQCDGLHVLITLPVIAKSQAKTMNQVIHAARQVFRKGIVIAYAFDDKVIGRGIMLSQCRKIVIPESGVEA